MYGSTARAKSVSLVGAAREEGCEGGRACRERPGRPGQPCRPSGGRAESGNDAATRRDTHVRDRARRSSDSEKGADPDPGEPAAAANSTSANSIRSAWRKGEGASAGRGGPGAGGT